MVIDLIFFITLLIAAIKGYSKGLVVAVFAVLSFIVGLAAAIKLSSYVANYLSSKNAFSSQWLPVISFLIVFIIVILLVRLGARIIEKTFQLAMLGWLNKAGGVLFYIILYTIIYSIVLFYLTKINLISSEQITASSTYSFVGPWAPKIMEGFGSIIPIFKDMFHDLEMFFDKLTK